jgi:hypothetical protein
MSEKIIESIKAGKYDHKELANLYANAERLGRKEVLPVAKEALKELNSRAYAKLFVKPIRDKVQKIIGDIAAAEGWANWEDNAAANGIRAGAPMTNGVELAEYCFSYRGPSSKSTSTLAVFQHDEHSAVQFRVKSPKGGVSVVNTSEEATELFRNAIKA